MSNNQNTPNDSTFSAPWHRKQLMAMNNYVGADTFVDLSSWLDRDAYLGDLLVVRNTTDPVYCVIVGVVSADNIRVQAHGNYNKAFSKMKLSAAKMQFTIKKPTNTVYENDFDLAIERFESIQSRIAVGNVPCKHFIIQDDKGNKCFRMSYPLFEKKTKVNDMPARRELTNSYPIGNDYNDEMLKLIDSKRFLARPFLRVLYYDGSPVHFRDFESELTGALVEVTFSLKHYTIVGNSTTGLSNTITSSVHQIIILQEAPTAGPSPFDEDEETRKGPIRLRQESPKKRKTPADITDQFAAAEAFGPPPARRQDPSLFVQGSSTSTPSMRHSSTAPTEGTIESENGANDNDEQGSLAARRGKRSRTD